MGINGEVARLIMGSTLELIGDVGRGEPGRVTIEPAAVTSSFLDLLKDFFLIIVVFKIQGSCQQNDRQQQQLFFFIKHEQTVPMHENLLQGTCCKL